MNDNKDQKEAAKDPLTTWINWIALSAGAAGGFFAFGTTFLAGYLLDPENPGLLLLLCGCLFGPLIGLFTALIEIVILRSYMKKSFNEIDKSLGKMLSIFGISIVAGIIIPGIIIVVMNNL